MIHQLLEQLAHWRQAIRDGSSMRQQQEAVLADIKRAQAQPIPVSELSLPLDAIPIGRVPRHAIDCPRLSPSGQLIGWYPPGQQRGRPIRLSPMQRQTHAFLKSLGDRLVYGDEPPTARHRARLGVAKRRGKSKAVALIARWREIAPDGSVPRGLPKQLAREFHCDANYVRRVLRKAVSGDGSSVAIRAER